MDITCVSDLHGNFPTLEGGDLLIVAGDLTARDTKQEYGHFTDWYLSQKYTKRILIAGNHDNKIQNGEYYFQHEWLGYLRDSGTKFEGLKVWGSPWTKTFSGMNPHCKAFTVDTEEELKKKWDLIPEDTDILITHGPPHGVLDENINNINCGSKSLLFKATSLKNLRLFVFGHIHEGYDIIYPDELKKFSKINMSVMGVPKCKSMPYIVNASHVNERYQPVNKPIRVIL